MKRLTALLIMSLATSLAADIIILNDGTRLDGDIKRTAEGYVVTDAAGKTTSVADADIRSIELKKAATNPTRPGPALSRPSETMESRVKGDVAASEVLSLITAGKTGEAAALLDKAIDAAPASPALLYLKGVLLFRQNQLVPARKTFESVTAALPDHAPTHNNLAVILYQTRSQMPALLEYDKAMLADPHNQQVLDNVAEALHALPQAYVNGALTKKVLAHFREHEAELEKNMAAQGLHRYGSQWLSEAEFLKLQSSQKAAQDKAESYNNDSLSLQTRLMRIDAQIEQDSRTMRSMVQEQTQVDFRTGQLVTTPLPQRYYELRQEIERLTAEKVLKQRQLEQLPKLLSEAQQAAASRAAFTGKQLIFDERFMPGAPPATQPATRPSR